MLLHKVFNVKNPSKPKRGEMKNNKFLVMALWHINWLTFAVFLLLPMGGRGPGSHLLLMGL